MPVNISDFAHGKPLPASTPDAAREDAPWMNILSDRERAQMRAFAAVIFPDRPITRRLTRHVLVTPTGHKFAALKTVEECWLYAQAMELTPVGLSVGEGVVSLEPLLHPPSLPDANQMGLFDTVK